MCEGEPSCLNPASHHHLTKSWEQFGRGLSAEPGASTSACCIISCRQFWISMGAVFRFDLTKTISRQQDCLGWDCYHAFLHVKGKHHGECPTPHTSHRPKVLSIGYCSHGQWCINMRHVLECTQQLYICLRNGLHCKWHQNDMCGSRHVHS